MTKIQVRISRRSHFRRRTEESDMRGFGLLSAGTLRARLCSPPPAEEKVLGTRWRDRGAFPRVAARQALPLRSAGVSWGDGRGEVDQLRGAFQTELFANVQPVRLHGLRTE